MQNSSFVNKLVLHNILKTKSKTSKLMVEPFYRKSQENIRWTVGQYEQYSAGIFK
jgi:hypothetical protein